ncbi:amino acid/amide ABC transporter substrate-binding protein, HAAT family [Rhizobiales bacterium GAS113]|nr:amino acid/amide ABC transporter substrate-binding protein, HAAT family [Rhizobiales bacterium GAS113]
MRKGSMLLAAPLALLLGALASGEALVQSEALAQSGPSCAGGSIKLGAISTVTGAADFSEVPKAAKAMFDKLNASGGIAGCKIDCRIEDDKGDPQISAQAARDLIDNDGVVAMVGGASFVDCQVNAGTYQRKGVRAVQGLGIDAACFNTPSVAPVNVGPFTLSTAMGYYATQALKVKKLCAFFIIVGGTQEAYGKGLAAWEKLSGQKIHLVDLTLPTQGDLTPYVIKARDAGCEAVINNSVEPGVVQWVKTADAQKITGIDWLFLAPGYTDQVAKALAGSHQPVYVGTEWEPYAEKGSAANKEWVETMNAAGRPLTAFSQGGYLSAAVLIDVLKSMHGEITRASVTQALTDMQAITNPLAGSAYVFGTAKTHSPMQATKVMKLDPAGSWTVMTPDWVVLPKTE